MDEVVDDLDAHERTPYGGCVGRLSAAHFLFADDDFGSSKTKEHGPQSEGGQRDASIVSRQRTSPPLARVTSIQ